MANKKLLELHNISKEFPGVQALRKVGFNIHTGEVHALVGENGAGKSTLIKILSGALKKWEGKIIWEENSIKINSPWMAQKYGIATIYQELSLCPNMTVKENIFLGREPVGFGGFIDWKLMSEKISKVFNELDVSIDLNTKVSTLSIANQQLVEIVRALTINAKLIIMDEPTSSLSEHEVNNLFKVIRGLIQNDVAVLYVSHKIDEIFEISNRISVLRDGKYMGTLQTSTADHQKIIKLMVGKAIDKMYKKAEITSGSTVFQVRNLTKKNKFTNIEFSIREGEIIGIAGLVGAGRTDFAHAIFGIDTVDSGEIYINDKWINIPESPAEAMQLGLGLVPEDRKEQGLVLSMSVGANISLAWFAKEYGYSFINEAAENNVVNNYIEKLRVKTPDTEQLVKNLSGGNQQKAVISKWLATEARVLIFDEPTRGIDVGAKAEIHEIMNQLVKQGFSIIMISSELPEILEMSDKILVMHEGTITGRFEKNKGTAEKIMACATGEINEVVDDYE